MNGKIMAGLVIASMSLVAQAQGRHAARVTLDGDWYLQAGEVLNQSDDGIRITGFTYSMGAQADGVGVWETYLSTGEPTHWLAGNSTHYSNEAWSALDVASQATWHFSGLDLDRIVNTATGEVDNLNLDFSGESLRNAYVSVRFSDGYCGHAHLATQGWDVTQVLYIGDAVSAVPEPGTSLMLGAGLGVVLLGRYRRRDAA